MVIPTSSQSSKTGGLIAEVDHDTFGMLLKKIEHPLVLAVRSGMPKTYKYLTEYKGYYFVTRSKEALDFSQTAEVITTTKIHLTPEWPNL